MGWLDAVFSCGWPARSSTKLAEPHRAAITQHAAHLRQSDCTAVDRLSMEVTPLQNAINEGLLKILWPGCCPQHHQEYYRRTTLNSLWHKEGRSGRAARYATLHSLTAPERDFPYFQASYRPRRIRTRSPGMNRRPIQSIEWAMDIRHSDPRREPIWSRLRVA